jgi:hypothetical protein
MDALVTKPALADVSFLDWTPGGGRPAEPELAGKCRTALEERVQRQSALPELYIDPLRPLPLADAAGGVVRFVYFIMASRPYGWETINRNVMALQRPGALEDVGSNDTNVFLVHVDAKLGESRKHELRDVLIKPRPDVYMLRRPRPVLWAGWSMILALFDAMASVLRRGLHFEYFINLSDADLSLRTDAELRAFFSRFEGRSIMSIVQRKKDPRRCAEACPPHRHRHRHLHRHFRDHQCCRHRHRRRHDRRLLVLTGTRCTRASAATAGPSAPTAADSSSRWPPHAAAPPAPPAPPPPLPAPPLLPPPSA